MTIKLVLTSQQYKLIQCMAAVAHPTECSGFFVGWADIAKGWCGVKHVVPMTSPWIATKDTFIYHDDCIDRIEGHYQGEEVVGGYHSHPNAHATASSHDKETLADFDFELIVSVWPGKRREWLFKPSVYFNVEGTIRRGQVRIS
jgi:proteasome lid subunit RPN8/RPN11